MSPTPAVPSGSGPSPTSSGTSDGGARDQRSTAYGATGERSVRRAAPGTSVAQVAIVDDAFQPSPLTITVGTTVIWTHRGRHPHTVTANDRSFDSGTLERGQTFSVTFNEVGRVPYYCQIHGEPGSGMVGLVIVRAAPEEPTGVESPSPANDALARTGTDSVRVGIVAFGLGVVGLVALRWGRRQRGEGG